MGWPFFFVWGKVMKVFKNTVEGKKQRLAKLRQKVKETEEKRDAVDAMCAHKDYHGNGYTNDVTRLYAAIDFVEVDREFYLDIDHQGSLFCINNKFLLTPIKKKWRLKGKAQWYRYSSPENFIKKYVFREAV
jgi:hypothetical protein